MWLRAMTGEWQNYEGTPGKYKPLHAEAWISCMCVGCGRGKCPSYKKDHQQNYRCLNNSQKYNVALMWKERYREIRTKSLAGATPLGLADFILIAVGLCGQILGLGMTTLDFQFRKTTVPTVWRVVWERGYIDCRQQNRLETSAVILGRFYGYRNMHSCSGEGEKWVDLTDV